jgi:hypothetical protein
MMTLPGDEAASPKPLHLPTGLSYVLSRHARAVIAVSVVVTALSSGCRIPSATSGMTTTTAPCAGAVAPVGGCQPDQPQTGTVAVGICSDGSGSMPPGVLTGTMGVVADAVVAWPGAPPSDPEAGADGRVGLEVIVRRISASSYAPAGLVLRLRVPGVPAIQPRPSVADPAFLDGNRRWRAQRDAAATALTEAQNAAQAGASSLRGASFESDGSSILGCVAALAESLPSASRRAVVVITDLKENGVEEVAGDLQGAPVFVVQPCDETPAPCAQRADHFEQLLAAMGAGPVTVIRPEALPDHLGGVLGDPVAH